MTKEDNRKERRSWWMQFLISVIGTAIGVGLTFAVSNRLENRKKEQAQRLTAMMVIHDIDESIERAQELKDALESQYNAMIYAMSRLDQFDLVPNDTLILAVGYILADENEFSFDTSKEKIFHSSPDTWQNLGSMKFIDNVQSFYFNRQAFLDLYNKSVYWQRPVPIREYEKLNPIDEALSVDQYIESFYAAVRKFLKEKMTETSVQHYMDYAAWRMSSINDVIEGWMKLNNENKFLMSITDEELEAYVNSINKTGVALKEENLIGTWKVSSSDKLEEEWIFDKDHSYKVDGHQTVASNMPFAKGNLKLHFTIEGTWDIESDSLIKVFDLDSYTIELDDGEMRALPGRQDMLDDWLKEYKKTYDEYLNDNRGRKERKAYGACMDASRDKIELKRTDDVQYLKRKK